MEKRVKITIDGVGNYGIEAMEGFSGTSCVNQTQELEVAIGGMSVEDGKTSAYYNPEDDNPVTLDLN